MPVYSYQARTVQGGLERGEIDAPSLAAARAQLMRRHIRPVLIKPKKKGITIPFLTGWVTIKETAIFTRQFATMIEAGLPLVQCLEALGRQQEKRAFQNVLKDVQETVEGGATLSDSMRRHKNVFDDLYVNMVTAGEMAGILDNVLERLATHMEKTIKLRNQVKSAMYYPVTIVAVAVGVVAVLLLKVIPVFAKLFSDFGAKLPAPTLFVIAISDLMQNYFLYIVAGAIALALLLWQLSKTKRGRYLLDKLLLSLPIFGPIVRKIAIARFSRTLGTMVQSGVAILDALEICARTSGNLIIEQALLKARTSISQGKTIAEPLEDSGVFPPMVVQMVSVGEATGNLDSMLSKIADFYEDEVDTSVKALTSLLEPVIMIVLGVIIGGLVIAMYLPIFTMAGVITG
ncbi:MAG: type II secretion system F family protein [Thermodesulfobacteriota bacterium]